MCKNNNHSIVRYDRRWGIFDKYDINLYNIDHNTYRNVIVIFCNVALSRKQEGYKSFRCLQNICFIAEIV